MAPQSGEPRHIYPRDPFRPALTEAVWFRNSAPEPHATASIFSIRLHSEFADRNDARIILARLKLEVEPVPFHYTAERSCSSPKVDVQQATEPLPPERVVEQSKAHRSDEVTGFAESSAVPPHAYPGSRILGNNPATV